jgi:ribosome biogenesis GTPase / thiamine phosphate phosphatase
VRVRPGRPSRPRTRIRPRHAGATAAFVVAVDRGRYTCVLAGGGEVVAMRARELGRRSVVVGDRVALVGDVTGTPGSLARIVRIEPRGSVLRRTADDEHRGPDSSARLSGAGSGPRPTERVIVANADLLVIVCALVDPPPRTGFIDRCLVAAYDADIRPLLCLTKADLPGADEAAAELSEYYADLDLDAVRCRPDAPLDALESRLTGRLSVLVGHSGVGKSTLVNRLVPGADRAVGRVSAIGKGRHTSTSVVALPLAGTEGWLVDTPGIRSFGLAHVSAQTLLHGFPDLAPAAADCPPGCDHTEGAPGCGLDRLVATDRPDAAGRLASYRRLLGSRN